MSVAAFVTVAFMFAMYVMLDGYDLGVATVAALIARDERDRSAAMASIGPFWNGNEVWLIAAAAALFALFPAAYAAAFSGFYLPFIIVLWLLMLRGIALELREHFPSEIWHQFWDAAFAGSSALLIFVFGIALGNLLRGVPLDAAGYFAGTFAFLLNPYALLVGVFALATLAQHGAAFAALRLDGDLGMRAARMLQTLWWAVLPLYLAVTAATFAVHGGVARWLLAMPLLSLAALAGRVVGCAIAASGARLRDVAGLRRDALDRGGRHPLSIFASSLSLGSWRHLDLFGGAIGGCPDVRAHRNVRRHRHRRHLLANRLATHGWEASRRMSRR